MKKLLNLLFTATLLAGLYFNVPLAVVAYWLIVCLVGFMWVLICCSDSAIKYLKLNIKELKMSTFSILATLVTFPMYVYVMCLHQMYNLLFCYVLVHLLIIAGQIKISKLTKEDK